MTQASQTERSPAAAEPPPGAMTLESVAFGYRPGDPVVSGVSATLHAGRVTALIGPNASGKSTLLRLMLGLLTPWSGEARLGGAPVTGMTPSRRARRIAYVPQRGSIGFAFTVRQVVGMGRFAFGGASDTSADAAIDLCDLAGQRDRPFNELSGGQQQRVTLARALAQAGVGGAEGAGVMLLDEPIGNMDLRHAHLTMARLRAAAGDGRAVLVVLHDLNMAMRWADDVWLMDGGRLAASGPYDEVLRPDLLGRVYGVRVTRIEAEAAGAARPVLYAEPDDRIV